MIHFGDSLAGPSNRALRARLEALAGGAREALHVHALLAAHPLLDPEGLSDRPPLSFLLFDYQRLYLYDEPEGGGGARIESVIRALVDAYPLQPFGLLAEHCRKRPYHFPYSLEKLDLLPYLLSEFRPGLLLTCDLWTLEVGATPAHTHPSLPGAGSGAPPRGARTEPPPPLVLQSRWVNASLRSREAGDLSGLVSPLTGIVRRHQYVTDYPSLPFSQVEIAAHGGTRRLTCFGKGFRAAGGKFAAICEAVERFHVISRPPGEVLVHGSYRELRPEALDPHAIFFPTGSVASPGPYTAETPMYWAWATDPLRASVRLVPAQEVWFHTDDLPGENRCIRPVTNGCAVGSTVEEAAVFALLEAIERDAYLTMWYLGRPCARIDPESIDDEPFQLLRRRWEHDYESYDLQLFDITNDTGVPAVAAFAARRRGGGPKSFHAAAARLSAERACYAALSDLAGFTPRMSRERRRKLRLLLDEPQRISSPEDHFGLFALDESFERLGFLDGSGERVDVDEVNAGAAVPVQGRYELRSVIHSLAERLHDIGASLLLKDITHPWFAERSLHCVKAITPGLYPMWFGPKATRFAVTDRLLRLQHQHSGTGSGACSDFNLSTHPLG